MVLVSYDWIYLVVICCRLYNESVFCAAIRWNESKSVGRFVWCSTWYFCLSSDWVICSTFCDCVPNRIELQENSKRSSFRGIRSFSWIFKRNHCERSYSNRNDIIICHRYLVRIISSFGSKLLI